MQGYDPLHDDSADPVAFLWDSIRRIENSMRRRCQAVITEAQGCMTSLRLFEKQNKAKKNEY